MEQFAAGAEDTIFDVELFLENNGAHAGNFVRHYPG